LHEELTASLKIGHWLALAQDPKQKLELHQLVLALLNGALCNSLCNGIPYSRKINTFISNMLIGSQEIVVTLLYGTDACQSPPPSSVFPKGIDLRGEQLLTALDLGAHLTPHLRHAAIATQHGFCPG
jgi:hypothetical protein